MFQLVFKQKIRNLLNYTDIKIITLQMLSQQDKTKIHFDKFDYDKIKDYCLMLLVGNHQQQHQSNHQNTRI
jgi:hypothetical protein